MNLPGKIRAGIGHYLFKKRYRQNFRQPKVVSFQNARNIGILYDATDMETYEVVKNYVKDIRSYSKEVLALGFVDKPELHRDQFAKLGLDFFTRKNVNWHMIPSGMVVSNFINKPYDILINLSTAKCFPLHYISALSSASFKIGMFNRRNEPFYDLLLDIKDNRSLPQFITHVNHYLNIIKTHHEEPA